MDLLKRFWFDSLMYQGLMGKDPEDIALTNMSDHPEITHVKIQKHHKWEFHFEA